MAKKFILIGGTFKNVSDDTIPAIGAALLNSPVGSMLFAQTGGKGLLAQAGHQTNYAGLCQNSAEVELSKPALQTTTRVAFDVGSQTYWSYNGTTWTSQPLTADILKAQLKPRRYYYNATTQIFWYVASDYRLLMFAKKDNPFATQTEVTNGSGTGLVSPATLKNAYGSW